MAISTHSALTSATSSNGNTVVTTGSISPTGDALIIATISARRITSTMLPITFSSTFSTGGWTTAVATEYQVGGTGTYYCVAIGWAIADSSPGSGTVTATLTNASNTKNLHVIEFASGYNSTTPLTNTKTGNNESSTLSLTLDSSPASGSFVIGAVASYGDVASATEGTGFTEIYDTVANSNQQGLQTQIDETSPGTTCDWSDLNTTANIALAVELQEAAGAGGTIRRNPLSGPFSRPFAGPFG